MCTLKLFFIVNNLTVIGERKRGAGHGQIVCVLHFKRKNVIGFYNTSL